MKYITYILVFLGLACCVVSCNTKKEEPEDIVVDKIVEKAQTGPIVMGNQESSGTVKWVSDGQYTYDISRSADSARIVKNHGKEYRDNNITLTVRRVDGSEFFKKKFTKENFNNVLPSDFMKSGVLTNMRFENVEGNDLNFVVTVGSPDENNEDYFLVKMTVNNMGHTSASVYHEILGED